MIYLFTGQPGSGKTSIGSYLLEHTDLRAIMIDGDDLRSIFNNKDYSRKGRELNIRRAMDLVYFLNDKKYDVIITMVFPYRKFREELKSKLDVVEVFVHTSDIRGRESYFAPDYEPPLENFIDLDTTNKTVQQSYESLRIRITKNRDNHPD